MISRRAFTAVSVAGLLFIAGQAFAHTRLVSSNPADKATVAAPKVITLTFSDKVTPAFSGFELSMTDGRHTMKVPVKTTVSRDGKTISGSPQSPLMKGAYTLTWHAASGDGHRMEGALKFNVS